MATSILAIFVIPGFGEFALLLAFAGSTVGLVCALVLGSKYLIALAWPRRSFGIVWVGLIGGALSGLYVTFRVDDPVRALSVPVAERWSIAVTNENFHAVRKAGERYYASDLEILLRRTALPIWLVIWGFMMISVVESGSFWI